MKIYKKHLNDIDINENASSVIVFPTSLYDCEKLDANSMLLKAAKINPRTIGLLRNYINNKVVDVGNSFTTNFKAGVKISFLVVSYNIGNKINKPDDRRIDYEFLYTSLINLCNDCLGLRITKMSVYMDDFKLLGCDLSILEAMIRAIFSNIPFSITLIYGE